MRDAQANGGIPKGGNQGWQVSTRAGYEFKPEIKDLEHDFWLGGAIFYSVAWSDVVNAEETAGRTFQSYYENQLSGWGPEISLSFRHFVEIFTGYGFYDFRTVRRFEQKEADFRGNSLERLDSESAHGWHIGLKASLSINSKLSLFASVFSRNIRFRSYESRTASNRAEILQTNGITKFRFWGAEFGPQLNF